MSNDQRRMIGRLPHMVIHGFGCCQQHAQCTMAVNSPDHMHTVVIWDPYFNGLAQRLLDSGGNAFQIWVELAIQTSIRKEYPNR